MADPKSIIYLESNKCIVYATGMEQPVTLAFPTGGIAYMEVLDKELVYNQIQTFIVTNKLAPGACTIILGHDVTFEKVIRQTQKEQKTELVENFYQNIPFDNVGRLTYDTQDTTYVFATNEELFTTIRRGFEKSGFSIDGVIPVTLFANANLPVGAPLTAQIAQYLIDSVEAVRQFNFINVRQELAQRTTKLSKKQQSLKHRKREKVLGGVFAGLLVVLFAVILTSNNSVAPANPAASQRTPAPAQSATVDASPTQAQAPTDGKQLVQIKIVNTQSSEDAAGVVKNALQQAGFASLDSESTSSAVSSVSFSGGISEIHKNELLTIIRPLLPDFTLLTHTDPIYSAILVVGP